MPDRAFTLAVDGAVERPLALTYARLLSLPALERDVTLDCGKGTSTTSTMKGPAFSSLLDLAGANDDACRAVFYCTDGHRESISIADLLLCDAFLACDTSEESSGDEDCAVRLVVPGKFGHRWAKSVKRIEIVADN